MQGKNVRTSVSLETAMKNSSSSSSSSRLQKEKKGGEEVEDPEVEVGEEEEEDLPLKFNMESLGDRTWAHKIFWKVIFLTWFGTVIWLLVPLNDSFVIFAWIWHPFYMTFSGITGFSLFSMKIPKPSLRLHVLVLAASWALDIVFSYSVQYFLSSSSSSSPSSSAPDSLAGSPKSSNIEHLNLILPLTMFPIACVEFGCVYLWCLHVDQLKEAKLRTSASASSRRAARRRRQRSSSNLLVSSTSSPSPSPSPSSSSVSSPALPATSIPIVKSSSFSNIFIKPLPSSSLISSSLPFGTSSSPSTSPKSARRRKRSSSSSASSAIVSPSPSTPSQIEECESAALEVASSLPSSFSYAQQYFHISGVILYVLAVYYYCQAFTWFFTTLEEEEHRILFSSLLPWSFNIIKIFGEAFASSLDAKTPMTLEMSGIVVFAMNLFQFNFTRNLFTNAEDLQEFLAYQFVELFINLLQFPLRMTKPWYHFSKTILQKLRIQSIPGHSMFVSVDVSHSEFVEGLCVDHFSQSLAQTCSLVTYILFTCLLRFGPNSSYYPFVNQMSPDQFETLMVFCCVSFLMENSLGLITRAVANRIIKVDAFLLGARKTLGHPLSVYCIVALCIHITHDVYIALIRLPFL